MYKKKFQCHIQTVERCGLVQCMFGGEWLLDFGMEWEKKKRFYSEGHQAALRANLSRGLPRRIVEQEEALMEALQTQAELHTGLKGAWHGVLCHRETLQHPAKENN